MATTSETTDSERIETLVQAIHFSLLDLGRMEVEPRETWEATIAHVMERLSCAAGGDPNDSDYEREQKALVKARYREST